MATLRTCVFWYRVTTLYNKEWDCNTKKWSRAVNTWQAAIWKLHVIIEENLLRLNYCLLQMLLTYYCNQVHIIRDNFRQKLLLLLFLILIHLSRKTFDKTIYPWYSTQWYKNVRGPWAITSYVGLKRRTGSNIKTDLKETECDVVSWINLAQDRKQWLEILNKVIHFLVIGK